MTIVVGVATPDGIVLAADSRMTLTMDDGNGGLRHRIGSDTGEKVFEVCGRYAVATFGDAMIGTQTIAGLMAEFEAEFESQEEPDESKDVARFADRLGEYFQQRYTSARADAGNPVRRGEEGALGFLVAGYDDSGVGHVYDVLIPRGKRAGAGLFTTAGGISPRGQTDVIWRLLRGFDADAASALEIRLDPRLAEEIEGLTYNVIYPVTLQDAIDLGMFLIRTTIDMQRFSDGLYADPGGVPGCGGPVNMIAVKQNGVEWVSRAYLTVSTRGVAEGAL